MRPSRTARLAALLLPLLMAPALMAQRGGVKVENLPNFDLRKYHFGFLLSYNTSDFIMRLKPEAPFRDSLMVLDHLKRPGFNLGIVASLRLNDNASLRFLPTLSFQERILQYKFLEPDGGLKYFQKPVESTYLEFPLALKLRSDRINNFAVYLLAGGKFSIDMATQKDVNQALDDEVVIKLEKYDYSVDVGGGFDFFLPYFKFGIELKAGFGLPNLIIDDQTRFSAPVESLRSKVWVLTFTFEG
ncbi:MAG: porin family protein [Flavobacteriales bacterium]|jgi:hypothetical protein|nr:porin family protein [Flavobacteriales bacterium]